MPVHAEGDPWEPPSSFDLYDYMLHREALEALDALPEAERAALLKWLQQRRDCTLDRAPRLVRDAVRHLREMLGVTTESS